MKLRGSIQLESKTLSETIGLPEDAKLTIDYDMEYNVSDAVELFNLAKRAPELVDTMAECARKFIQYQGEFANFGKDAEKEPAIDEDIAEAMAEMHRQKAEQTPQ